MEAIRKVVHRDKLSKIIPIPESFGENVEVIVLPSAAKENAAETIQWSENERFLASVYHAVIPDDEEEDRIWEKYL